MQITKYIKSLFLSLLTLLLGANTTHAKTELVLPQKQVVFSIEQTPKASTLEKEVQPNVGFLKEKFKFVAVEGVSAEKTFAFAERVGGKLANAGGEIASTFPKLASKLDDWAHLGLNFNKVDDIVKVTTQNGTEIARVVKNGSDEILEISDDFFKATGNNITPITGITVKTTSGETIIGGGFVKNTDGTIGFIEDVSSYGSQIVQNTIKNRGNLRSTISGIQVGQEAHHYIPVQLLKENNVVKKAVEAGFDFNNGAVNGVALDKYVASSGIGRHGPHPNYTNQIRDYLDNVWVPANPNYTAQMAKQELEDIVLHLDNVIRNTTGRINLIDLGLTP